MSAEVDALLQISSPRPELLLGERVKAAADVNMPTLRTWNYEPCRWHDEPRVDCEYRACGGPLLNHQRKGVAWLYAVRRGLLADETGLGKTGHILFLTAMLKERGELTNRAIVVCQTPAVRQWVKEYNRFAPGLEVIGAVGSKRQRVSAYTGVNWDVCVIGYHMLLRDLKMLEQFEAGFVAIDDVDPLKNPSTATHRACARLASIAERSVVMNATPLQIRLQDLYAMGVPIGTADAFGTLRSFERRHVRVEAVPVWTKKGKKVVKEQTVGYKNMTEFKAKMGPLFLRRRYEDVDDVRIPDIAPPEPVWLDLHPAQRRKYTELQEGVLRIMRAEGETVKRASAIAQLTYGAEICSSLTALGEPDSAQASSKGDWLLDKVTGDWSPVHDPETGQLIEAGRKVIVFVRFRGTVTMLQNRLAAAGVGTARVWGEQGDHERDEEVTRFWQDPACQVMIGTSAMERSLNLQVANIVVNFDTLLNPARMAQVLGRSRRVGSKHGRVYVFNLFTRETQEEGYLDVLEQRQALADYVWDEDSPMYESLSPIALLQLISP